MSWQSEWPSCYGMLPRAADTRMRRDAAEGRRSGRTQEIQRLIGRSLRDLMLGQRWLSEGYGPLGVTMCAPP